MGRLSFLLLFLLCLVPVPALPADSPPADGEEPPTLAEQVQALLEAEQRAVEDLRTRIEATDDPGRILALQRGVELVKLRTERQVLSLQYEAARTGLDETQRRHVEEALRSLDERIRETRERLRPADLPPAEGSR